MSDEETVYIVVEDFTDTMGRAWKEGEEFVVTEDDTCTQAALEAGQIEESTPDKIKAAKDAKAKKAAAEKARAEKEAADAKQAAADKIEKERKEAEERRAKVMDSAMKSRPGAGNFGGPGARGGKGGKDDKK